MLARPTAAVAKAARHPALLRGVGSRTIWASPHVDRESDGGLVREDEPHLKRPGKE